MNDACALFELLVSDACLHPCGVVAGSIHPSLIENARKAQEVRIRTNAKFKAALFVKCIKQDDERKSLALSMTALQIQGWIDTSIQVSVTRVRLKAGNTSCGDTRTPRLYLTRSPNAKDDRFEHFIVASLDNEAPPICWLDKIHQE